MDRMKHSQSTHLARDSQATEVEVSLQLDGLPGIWLNTSSENRQIAKVVIAVREQRLWVHAFGARDSVPRDWGVIEADQVYAGTISSRVAAGFTAWYHLDGSQVHLQANWNQGLLVLASFTSFKDGSKRFNYFAREFFRRELAQEQEN
jgi:hypothetical protein